MSEDASPTGGPVTPPQTLAGQDAAATDHNNSIIEKVRSRVTSIIPFGKWFSPTAGGAITPISGEQGSRNGGVRRRRDDTVIGGRTTSGQDRRIVVDESDAEDLEEEEEDIAPPTKRSRLNVPEDQSLIGSFQIARGNASNSFLSSTPHIGARKQLNLKSINQPLHCTINSSTTMTRTTKSTTSKLIRDVPQLRSDTADNDALEVIPENQDVVSYASAGSHWEREQRNSKLVPTCDRRELKLPTRRPSLHRTRGYGEKPTSSIYSSVLASSSYQNQDEDDTFSESVDDESKKINDALTNGVRASPNLLDTASESGESQASSVQKSKATEKLYIAGVKRFRHSNGSGLNYAAHLQGKKSLFGDKNTPSYLNNSTMSLTSLNRRQSFNTSLYGSTSALSDSRLLNTYSPFYKGNTTYGGAAAYSKYSQNARRANPVPTLIRPSSSLSTSSSIASSTQATDTSATISNTAKRILELMNQFTTPLSDAKKMANNTKVPALTAHRQRFNEADRSMNKGIRMTTPKTPYSRPKIVQSKESKDVSGPPVNELHVPSMSQLLQMKKLQSNTERAREITRTNQAKTSATVKSSSGGLEYRLPSAVTAEESSSKHVNKIKNKLTSTRASSKNIEDDMVSPVFSLPDIPLPLKESAVPKIDFNFGKPAPASNSATASKDIASAARNSVQSKDKVSVIPKEFKAPITNSSGFSFGGTPPKSSESSAGNGNNTFKFGNPTIPKSATPVANGSHAFIFSAPIQVTAPTSGSSNQDSAAATSFKFSDPVPVENSAKLSNPAGNFAFGSSNSFSKPKPVLATNTQSTILAVAPQLKTAGSVLDVFKKPTPAEATSTSVSTTGSFGAQFKMTSDKWECSVCMIRNEKSADKCVACCTTKPSSEPAKTGLGATTANANLMKSSTPLISLTNSFGDKFKANTSTWECSVCMIRNKIELSNCAACTTAKPGSSSTSASSGPKTAAMVSSSSSLVPNKPADSGFKSIVATQSAKWECSACMTRNESARNKCACCEQAKPGASSENVPQFAFGASSALPAESKFSFGFGAKSADESKKGDSSQAKPAGEVKQSFTFGASSTAATAAPAASFSFGFKQGPGAEQNKDETDKSTSSPKVTFGSVAQPAKSDAASETSSKPIETLTKKDPEPTGFKFGSSNSAFSPSTFSLTSATNSGQLKSTSSTSSSSTTLTTSSSSIFKPIGTAAFAPSTDKKSEESAKAPMFGFGSTATKPVTTESISGKTDNDSNSGGTKQFTFGSSSALKSADDKPLAEVKPATGFTFGSSSSITSGTAFKSPLAKPAPTASVPSDAGNANSFVFGKPSTPASITPTFGAVSSNIITSSNPTGPVSTAAPSFGALSASTTTSSFQSTATSSIVSASTFGSGSSIIGGQPTTNLFGSSSFNSASSSSATTENKPGSNLFQFGAASKSAPAVAIATTAAAPIFGNVSSTTSGRFSFGSANTAPNAGPSSQATPFVFGSSSNADKPKESTAVGLFGSASAPSAQNSTTTPSLPAFGSFSSPLQTQQQSTVQPAQPTLFGQTSNMSSPFGSNLGTNSTPTFGSTSAAANAVVPAAIGSTFGSGNTTTLFGNGFNSTPAQNNDEPASKKRTGGFNFGPTPPNQTGGFAFGASTVNNNNNNNNNESKPFSFSASGGTPSFNFTGNPEAINASQPFQFGAPQITPAAFNFSGIETTPNAPFQFNAAPAANNIFAVAPTPGTPQSAAMARRKARTVTRRTQPR